MDKFISRLCLISGVAALSVHFLLAGIYNGVAIGVGRMSDFVYRAPGTTFTITHSDPYSILGDSVIPLTWALTVFVLLKVFEKGWVWHSITLLSIGVSLACWISIELVRNDYLSDTQEYLNPLRESSNYSWTILVFLCAAFVLQSISIFLGLKVRGKSEESEVLP